MTSFLEGRDVHARYPCHESQLGAGEEEYANAQDSQRSEYWNAIRPGGRGQSGRVVPNGRPGDVSDQ